LPSDRSIRGAIIVLFLGLLPAFIPTRALARNAEQEAHVRQLKTMQHELMLGAASREMDEMRKLAARWKNRKSKGMRSEPPRDHQEALGAQGMSGIAHGLRNTSSALPINSPLSPSSQIFTTQSEISVAGVGKNLVAAWNDAGFRQNRLNAISFSTSTDGGETWREGGPLPVGGPVGVWISDPVTTVNEKTGYFYLTGLVIGSVGPSNGVGMIRGRFGPNGFAWEMPRLARGIRDTFPDKPWLVADSLTGNLYLSYTTFYRRQGKTTDRIEFQRSEDGGLTWTPASKASPDEEEGLVQGSRPAVGPGGILHLVWKTVDTTAAAGGLDAMRIRSSGDGGRTFGAAFDAARLYTNFCSGPPGFDRGFGLGFPSIAVERGTSHPGRIHVAWEESLNFYDDLLPLTDVVEEVEPNEVGDHATPFAIGQLMHGAIAPPRDVDWFRFHGEAGRTVILYLDSLDTRLDVALRLWCLDAETRLAYSTSLNVRQRVLLYTLTKPGEYFVSIAPNNDSTGVYRLASGWAERGAERGRDQRDIFVAHSDDGAHWSMPALATDSPSGFDDWLPELAIGGDGKPYVAWYDWREGDPQQCGAAAHVRLARSDDSGDHWSTAGVVTEVPTIWSSVSSNQSPNMGDYIALYASADGMRPAWADGRSGDPDVYSAFWLLGEAVRRIAPMPSEVQPPGVIVRWTAPSPRMLATVYRRMSGGSAVELADIQADAQGVLSYYDIDLVPGYRYHFELAVRSTEGELRVGQQSIDAPDAALAALAIERVAPNPSAGAFRIAFRRPNLAPARIEVLDVSGRRVFGQDLGGEYGARGVLDIGRQTTLDAGLYLVRLIQGSESVSAKAVVVR